MGIKKIGMLMGSWIVQTSLMRFQSKWDSMETEVEAIFVTICQRIWGLLLCHETFTEAEFKSDELSY